VLGDFYSLHAGAETHSSIGLSKTANHATAYTSNKRRGTETAGIVFGFGGNKKEDSAFSGGFDPGLFNVALADAISAT
jgi:hypothetical protein